MSAIVYTTADRSSDEVVESEGDAPSGSVQKMPVSELATAIGYGGLVSGILDAVDGVVAFGFYGKNPIQVLQFIASGAFGASAFDGGLLTAGAGTVFHFIISFGAAAVYVLAAKYLLALRRHWVVAGLLYGVWVWAFMNFGVLPLSAVVPGPSGIGLLLNGIIGHALFVGVPIAYFARSLPRSEKLQAGDRFPLTTLETVNGETVRPEDGKLLHVEFRRWVGCPICNTHVGQLIRRADEIKASGIREVLVFHSSADEVRSFRSDVPFDLVADRNKDLCRAVGAETSLLYWLSPKTLLAAIRGLMSLKVSIPLRNGPTGLPAEFLVDNAGMIVAAKYGKSAYDQWSVDELLALAKNAQQTA